MSHIAATNYQFCAGLKDSDPPTLPSPADKDGVVKFLNDSFDYCSAVIPPTLPTNSSVRSTTLPTDGCWGEKFCSQCTFTWPIIVARLKSIFGTKAFARRPTGFEPGLGAGYPAVPGLEPSGGNLSCLAAILPFPAPASRRRYNLVREHETMKHRVVHFLQKYLFNPPIKFLFAIGLAPPGYALLETTGCKSGKLRHTPVGNALVDRQFWIVAEHGMKAGYVRNIVANPRVRVKRREGFGTRWHTGTAHVLSDDDSRERQRWLAKQLPDSGRNGAAVRFFGTQLLTVRIDLDA